MSSYILEHSRFFLRCCPTNNELLTIIIMFKKKLKPAETRAISVLSILYLVGIIGIALPIHPDFIRLTPLNLLVSLGVVLAFHRNWNNTFYIFLVISYLTGFCAELFGVQTGLLFGDYTYGSTLGFKLWGTPLMIGINWVMLAYATGVLSNTLLPQQHWLLRAAVAAGFMVALDVLIEPVAMRYDFWSWKHDMVPIQNYIGWFFVALPLLCIFTMTQPAARNKVAIALFILQVIFFLALNLL